MKKIVKDRKDIAFYIILYPLPMHKEAEEKSKAIMCEKSLSLLEDAFENKKMPKPKCTSTVIAENIEAAKKMGISSTPALVFPNGVLLLGYRDAESILKYLDKK